MAYIGNQPTSVAFLTDQFSGNGSTTAFTLSAAPANTNSILVAISGVLQDPSTYSISGTTLTFSPAPPTGTGNISVRFLGIPASGVTTTAYRTQTEFTATAGQTTFSVPSYTVGYIDVYRNGVLLGSADFTATSGTTVVLATGASAGDLVETVSFYVSSVLNAIPAVANAVTDTYLNTGAVTTAKIADANVTPAKLSQPFTSGTAVASTSGTSIDFTSIPNWVKRITVMFNNVSLNGNAEKLLQLGTSSGVTTSGYESNSVIVYGTNSVIIASSASGFLIRSDQPGEKLNGHYVFTLISANNWVGSSIVQNYSDRVWHGAGKIDLSGTLDRVRITSTNGTDTFDAGTINILYE